MIFKWGIVCIFCQNNYRNDVKFVVDWMQVVVSNRYPPPSLAGDNQNLIDIISIVWRLLKYWSDETRTWKDREKDNNNNHTIQIFHFADNTKWVFFQCLYLILPFYPFSFHNALTFITSKHHYNNFSFRSLIYR